MIGQQKPGFRHDLARYLDRLNSLNLGISRQSHSKLAVTEYARSMKIVIAIPPTFYPRHSYGITGVGLTADPGVAEGAPDLGSEGRPVRVDDRSRPTPGTQGRFRQ